MKRIFVSVLVMIAEVSQAHAWGAKGHQIVTVVGSTVSNDQPFWTANAQGMKQLSTVPDRVWKNPNSKEAEAPNHWFQADAYVKDLKQCDDLLKFPRTYQDALTQYGEPTVTRNGTAPWRIAQLYKMAVSDFKAGNTAQAVQEAGTMSHYIGDLSMPLHVSENYDGQETGNKGIHGWFETQNIGDENAIRDEVMKRTQALLANPSFMMEQKGDMSTVITREIIRSLMKRDEVLSNDTKLGRNSSQAMRVQLDLAEDRMADGAAVLSLILARLAKDAGIQNNKSMIPINDPSFIGNNFTDSSALNTPITAPLSNFDDDDCQAI